MSKICVALPSVALLPRIAVRDAASAALVGETAAVSPSTPGTNAPGEIVKVASPARVLCFSAAVVF